MSRSLGIVFGWSLLLGSPAAFSHGLIQDPPSRNWLCGAVTKPDQVLNGTAQYPFCGGAFASDFNGGYSFMSVLTHAKGRAAVQPLPENVCGFNSETWQGRATPWDQPINWPASNISAGPRTFSWNISWGPHFSDTEEFRYWITKPSFQFQVGKPLAWSDFEEAAFCNLKYDDANPSGNKDVTADKAGAMFHTKCTVPQRQGRHVIYGEWGRNQWTYERFHSCVDVAFTATGPDFSLSTAGAAISIARGASQTSTVAINRTGGFSGPVAFSLSGLPAGVTAAFSPATSSAATASLTLTVSSMAAIGSSPLTITGVSGSISRTLPFTLTVAAQPDFSLSAAQSQVTINKGGTKTTTLNITRVGGFTGAVSLAVSGLPSGLSAVFNPSSTNAASTNITFSASSSAATGAATATVTGTNAGVSRNVQLALIVAPEPSGSFSLSLPPQSLSLSQGSTKSTAVSISRTGGFSGPVNFSVSESPAGVSAVVNPAAATGGTTTLTLTTSSAAITGAGTLLLKATGAGSTVTLSVPFTVTPGATTGTVSLAPVVNVNHGWYSEIALRLDNTAPITSLSVTIEMQKTAGLRFAGLYNTIGGQIQQSNTATANTLRYSYSLLPGQTLGTGSSRIFAAQAGGSGTAHPTAGDTFTVDYVIGGVKFSQSGRF